MTDVEDQLESHALEVDVEGCASVAVNDHGSIRQPVKPVIEFFLSRGYGAGVIQVFPVQDMNRILRRRIFRIGCKVRQRNRGSGSKLAADLGNENGFHRGGRIVFLFDLADNRTLVTRVFRPVNHRDFCIVRCPVGIERQAVKRVKESQLAAGCINQYFLAVVIVQRACSVSVIFQAPEPGIDDSALVCGACGGHLDCRCGDRNGVDCKFVMYVNIFDRDRRGICLVRNLARGRIRYSERIPAAEIIARAIGDRQVIITGLLMYQRCTCRRCGTPGFQVTGRDIAGVALAVSRNIIDPARFHENGIQVNALGVFQMVQCKIYTVLAGIMQLVADIVDRPDLLPVRRLVRSGIVFPSGKHKVYRVRTVGPDVADLHFHFRSAAGSNQLTGHQVV